MDSDLVRGKSVESTFKWGLVQVDLSSGLMPSSLSLSVSCLRPSLYPQNLKKSGSLASFFIIYPFFQ